MDYRTFLIMPVISLLMSMPSISETFDYFGGDMIGQTKLITAEPGDSLKKIARQYDMGLDELKFANARIQFAKLKAGDQVLIPSQYILPDAPREGIVINLAEKRLYFYHPTEQKVSTFPVTIGRRGWLTPRLTTKIVEKRENPVWYVPKSIRNYTLQTKGKLLPTAVGPGPNNPLGEYALRLGLRTVLIHGTNNPDNIGVRLSSGCIRMYPEDIKTLFSLVSVGTPVQIVDQPYKVAFEDNRLYIESQMALHELWRPQSKLSREFKTTIKNAIGMHDNIRWYRIKDTAELRNGYPTSVEPFYD